MLVCMVNSNTDSVQEDVLFDKSAQLSPPSTTAAVTDSSAMITSSYHLHDIIPHEPPWPLRIIAAFVYYVLMYVYMSQSATVFLAIHGSE